MNLEEMIKFIKWLSTGEQVASDEIGQDAVSLKSQTARLHTCFANDLKVYETAILISEEIYIVERYNTKEKAIEGHQKWIKEAKNGSIQFFDPQYKVFRMVE